MFRKRHLLPVLLLLLCSPGTGILRGQTVTDTLQTGLQFSTDFECGSLERVRVLSIQRIPAPQQPDADSVQQIVCDVYSRHDPDNPADPGLAPSARWYHFRMTGVKGKEIVLQLRHSDARRPFYSYDGQQYVRFTPEESPDGRSLTKIYERDSVYIAYFTPYPESYLLRRIADWESRPCVSVSSIGRSEHGREMPLLTITNGSAAGKKKVYIHGRVHPSESPASWHLDRMIEILSGDSGYASDLRDHAVFYILPFTNPDGVQEGMSRSNGQGINLEVNWDKPEELTAAEVKNMRSFLEKAVSDGRPLDLVLNMHSQSDNFATYWVHKAAGTSPAYYKDLMLFACLTTHGNPYFNTGDLRFSNVSPKYVEGWCWDRFREKTLAVTFETPYTFYSGDPDGEWVSLENLRAMALHNVFAIGDFLGLPSGSRMVIPEPRNGRRMTRQTDPQHTYFGESYLKARKNGASVKYKHRRVPRGTYEVYRWDVGVNDGPDKTLHNGWVKAGECVQPREGRFRYGLPVEAGQTADNILLLKKQPLNRP